MNKILSSQKSIKNGINAIVWQEGKWFVAKCLEIELASQGKNQKEALKNLEEAMDLYFSEEKVPLPLSLKEPELHFIPMPQYQFQHAYA